MPKHNETYSLNYSAEQMFSLVSDVNKYSEFLPWCNRSVVIKNMFDSKGNEILIADLHLGYKFFQEKFRSEVHLSKKKTNIKITYISGPFEYLVNEWSFTNKGKSNCDILFNIDFEFKNKYFDTLMNAFFIQAFKKMVIAFEERALKIYGKPKRNLH